MAMPPARGGAVHANALVRRVVGDATEFPSRSLVRDVEHLQRTAPPAPPAPPISSLVLRFDGDALPCLFEPPVRTVQEVMAHVHELRGVARVRQRLWFEGDPLPSTQHVALAEFGVRDFDELRVEIEDSEAWVARVRYITSLEPAPNATLGRCDPVSLVVNGGTIRREVERLVAAHPPPVGTVEALLARARPPNDVRVEVTRLPPWLKRRAPDGEVRAWRRHEALGAARALAGRLPQHLVRMVLERVARPPEEWERGGEPVEVCVATTKYKDGDLIVSVRPAAGRQWPADAHLRVAMTSAALGQPPARHPHPLIECDKTQRMSLFLGEHAPFRTWHLYTESQSHARSTRDLVLARDLVA